MMNQYSFDYLLKSPPSFESSYKALMAIIQSLRESTRSFSSFCQLSLEIENAIVKYYNSLPYPIKKILKENSKLGREIEWVIASQLLSKKFSVDELIEVISLLESNSLGVCNSAKKTFNLFNLEEFELPNNPELEKSLRPLLEVLNSERYFEPERLSFICALADLKDSLLILNIDLDVEKEGISESSPLLRLNQSVSSKTYIE